MKYKIGWLPFIIIVYLIPVIYGFYYIGHYAVNVPYWDQWDTIVLWTIEWHEGNFDFGRLFFEAQNDSRLFVPSILMIAVSILTDLNVKMFYYTGYLVYTICIIVFFYFIKTDIKLDYPTLILLVPLSFYAFNPYYMARFTENMGAFTYPIMILSAFIALYLLSKSKTSYSHFFSSIFMGFVCTFSGAPGLTIWFAGFVQLILQNMHRKWGKVAIWIISALGTFYVYFILLGFKTEGIHSTGAYSSFLMTSLHYPFHKFLCFMGVIGAEVIHNKEIALFFGLIIFFVAIALIYVNRKFLDLDRFSKWYGMLIFGTLISLELALTRSGSESLLFGTPDTIFYIPSIRHSLVIFLPIMCIFVLSIIYTKNSIIENSKGKECNAKGFIVERKHLNLFLLGIIFTLILCGSILHILPGLSAGESAHNQQAENQYILQNYAIAPDHKLASLYPDPDTLRAKASKLEQYKLNVFANSNLNSNSIIDWDLLIHVKGGIMVIDLVDGKPYSSEDEMIHIDKKTKSYIEFTGWAADDLSKDGNVKSYLVFKNESDEIIIPTIKTTRQDVANHFGVESYRYSGWTTVAQTKDFKEGCYDISLRILRENGAEYYELSGDKTICFD